MKIKIIILALLCSFSLASFSLCKAGAAFIEEAECFIDQDPGEGNGIEMYCTDGSCNGEREEIEVIINLSNLNLKIGYHIVYCRVKNDSGQWSMPRPIVNDLWITNPNLGISGQNNVAAIECFFDTDPGPGNGISCQCKDGVCDQAEEEIICTDIDVSGLSEGMHQLYCRMRDSQDSWGLTRKYKIQTYEPPYLVAGEWFVDSDPGEGGGNPILAPKDGTWDEPEEIIEEVIDVSGYSSGDHFMNMRLRDNYGRWGLPSCKPFGENPCECDLNGDGSCNILDWPLFIEDWGRSDCHDLGIFCECDLNSDGNCNILDWPYFIDDWGQTSCSTCPLEW
jgi:hypothetical protein